MLGNISVSCSIFVCQPDLISAINVVCEQAISYAEHAENSAQQSDLSAAVNAKLSVWGGLVFFPVSMSYA